MPFKVSGPFELKRTPGGIVAFGKDELAAFWEQTAKQTAIDLRTACGCYVLALQNGENIVPWYVGKAEKATFEVRCFDDSHFVTWFQAIGDGETRRRGKPLLFLLPRCTPTERLSKPGTWHDIRFLETMLIGMALRRNPDLLNVQHTRMLREMIVPGVINTPPGKPRIAETQLRQALGISNKRQGIAPVPFEKKVCPSGSKTTFGDPRSSALPTMVGASEVRTLPE
jgi:hypothetical protein